MPALLEDIKYSLRALSRSPAVAVILLGSLAVGTGANATVYSLVNALLVRTPAGVADPRTLLSVYTSQFDGAPYGYVSYPDFESVRNVERSFSSVAAVDDHALVVWRVGDASERVRVAAVTADYFSTLGLRAARGHLLEAVGPSPDMSDAVISYRLWQRALGGDDAAIGRIVTVADRPYRLVGVAPEGFDGLQLGRACEVWVPMEPDHLSQRGERRLAVIARLHPEVTLEGTQHRLKALGAELADRYPETNRGSVSGPDDPRRMTLMRHSRLDPALRMRVALISAVMLGATCLVLLSACANAGSLLLSRATGRGREMAVRFALGATRGRLLRLLLTESLLVSLLGGAIGLLLASWTATTVPSFFPPEHAQMLNPRLDPSAFAITLVISLLAGVGFGLTPALQATRPMIVLALRSDGSGVSEAQGGARLRTLLVTAQIALSVVLLVATTIVMRSLTEALRADPGFARNVAIASVEMVGQHSDQIRGVRFLSQALDRLRKLPNVEAAAWVAIPPLARGSTRIFLIYTGGTERAESAELEINAVSPGYFEAMKITLVAGREFDARDRPRSLPVAVINDELARRYFRGSAVGEWMRDADNNLIQIVGVVKAGKYRTLQDSPQPTVYVPLLQSYQAQVSLVARMSGDPATLLEPLRDVILQTDSGITIFRTVTLDTLLSESLAVDRLTTGLVATCGAMALILAIVGVYAIMADVVARRTREIGVRVALGARPIQIAKLVYAQGLGVTGAGLIAGMACAFGGVQLVESTTEGVASLDPATIAAIPAILTLLVVAAALVPTSRALRVDPTVALRE